MDTLKTNTICLADGILITSASVSGLQSSIDRMRYFMHGLNLSIYASKSSHIAFTKSNNEEVNKSVNIKGKVAYRVSILRVNCV